jgi:predicted RND superfamily exporter protein
MRKLVPIMMAVVLAVLMLTLRSGVATGLIMLSIVLSIIATMGVAGWGGVVLSAPVATAPLTVLIMAIADGVHVLSHYGRGLDRGLGREEAMAESLGKNLPAMLLTNVLAAIGYLAMNFSEVPPFQTLGNVVAAGITIGFLMSVLLVPALAMLLPATAHSGEGRKITWMVRYQEFFLAHRNKFLAASLALTVAMGYSVTKLEFNDSFHEYFDRSTEFRQASEFTLNNLTGVYMMDYSVSAGGADQVYRPEFLQKVDAFAAWYRQQPEVLHVSTVTDVMKRLNKNMHGDNQAYYRLPESRELAAQYLLLYELSLPYGLDLTNQINMDKSATRLTVTLRAVKSGQMIALEQRAAQWLQQHGDGVLQTPGAAGAGLMFAHIGQSNNKSMMVGNVYQLMLVSFLIIFAIRSFKIGAISLVPNLAPAAIAYGAWGLAVGEVSMGVSIVGGISLGIVVDDTIHFLSKYMHARREKKYAPEDAVRYAFDMAGVPMWISTFTLVAGFLVLATSPFAMNSDMGILTAATVGIAALIEACMLPALLLLIDRPRRDPAYDDGSERETLPKAA